MKRWEDYAPSTRSRFVAWLGAFSSDGITQAAAKRLDELRSGMDMATAPICSSDDGVLIPPSPYVQHQPKTTGRTVAKGGK